MPWPDGSNRERTRIVAGRGSETEEESSSE
jgi:hypothetical protein